MFKSLSIELAPWLLAVAVIPQPACAQEESPVLKGWQKLFAEHAREYAFVVEGNVAPVELVPKPILHWSQPVRGGGDGAVYVWTQNSKPFAIGTLFIWPQDNGKQGISHEMHSLSSAAFVAKWRDRRWTPPADGVLWKPIERAPPPAKTAEQRLRQMRDLAKEFSAESEDKNGKRWELRLLPRPIYQYTANDPKEPKHIWQGALFGFAEGSDLEIVMLLQAELGPEGERWQVAFARMSDFRLQVSQGDKPIWQVEPSKYDQFKAAYNCSTVESRAEPDGK